MYALFLPILESLEDRLESGNIILCAEGYVLGLARRAGYVGTALSMDTSFHAGT